MTPDKSQFAREFLGPRLRLLGDTEETRANSFAAVNAGCLELRKSDTRWGLLEKTGGAQVRQRAADIWLYDLGDGTAQVVDVVVNAEGEDGKAPSPSWGLKDFRPVSQWRVPYTDVPAPPPPQDPPPPPPSNDEWRAAVDEVSARVGELAEHVSSLIASVTSARDDIDTLRQRLADCNERIGKLRIVPSQMAEAIGTSRSFGHGHSIRVEIDG